MRKQNYRILFAIVVCMVLFYPYPIFGGSETLGIGEIAKKVATGVADGGLLSLKKTEPAVIILDETHNSREGQLQQAIVLERLYRDFQMRNLALEGYLDGEKDLSTKWAENAANGDHIELVSVAIRLLEEAEISAAEFMKLIHNDINIHPIEKREYYESTEEIQNGRPVDIYLLKIASRSATSAIKNDNNLAQKLSSAQSKLKAIIEEFREIEKGTNTSLIERKRKEMSEALESYRALILSTDKWSKDKHDEYLKDWVESQNPSLRKELTRCIEIRKRAEELSIELTSAEKDAMTNHINFLSARDKASHTMAETTIAKLKETDSHIIAMVIGIGHTKEIVDEFHSSSCSYACITPLAIRGKDQKLKSDIPWGMYSRKYQRKSLYSDGFLESILQGFPPPISKKPQTVLNEPWFQAKTQIYLFTDRIVQGIFPASGGGTGIGGIPPGWGGDTFKGKWATIDPRQIAIFDDKNESLVITDKTLDGLRKEGIKDNIIVKLRELRNKSFDNDNILIETVKKHLGTSFLPTMKAPLLKHAEKTSRYSVLFPLNLSFDSATKKTIWVKATKGKSDISSTERENVEGLLEKALERVKSYPSMKNSVCDDQGRVQITEDVIAAFGQSKESVQDIPMI